MEKKVCYTCNKTLFWFIFLGHARYVTLRGACLKCDETKTGSGWVSLEGYSTNLGKIPTKLRRSVTGRKRPPQPEAAACSVTTDPPPYANLSTTGEQEEEEFIGSPVLRKRRLSRPGKKPTSARIMSFSSTSAWTDEPAGNESTARMQDEVDLNCKF